MTPEQAAALFARVTASFPRTDVKQATEDAWLKELRPLDQAAGEQVIDALLNLKTFPTIGHLREQVNALREAAIRERLHAERLEAERELDELERVPLAEIPGLSEFLARLGVRHPPPDLELVDDGVCDDCGRGPGARYQIGQFQVCADCGRARLKAAGRAA